MGYTHYWGHRRFSDAEWKALTTAARKILRVAQDDLGIALSEDYDANNPPVVNVEHIWFNGYAEEGHETFAIKRSADRDFCKTARKPYDGPVVAVLIEAALINDGFSWSSDGDGEPELTEVADEILNQISAEDSLNETPTVFG